jgi:hypothetical protein
MNSFNTVVSQLLSGEIKISDEDKCIILLCSLLDSWESLFVSIGSNTTTLIFDDVVSSLLLEEMGWNNMEGQSTDALFAMGCCRERNISYSSSGISKSPGKVVKICWRCGKEGKFKKKCRFKSIERVNGSEGAPYIEEKDL